MGGKCIVSGWEMVSHRCSGLDISYYEMFDEISHMVHRIIQLGSIYDLTVCV